MNWVSSPAETKVVFDVKSVATQKSLWSLGEKGYKNLGLTVLDTPTSNSSALCNALSNSVNISVYFWCSFSWVHNPKEFFCPWSKPLRYLKGQVITSPSLTKKMKPAHLESERNCKSIFFHSLNESKALHCSRCQHQSC